MLIGIVAHPDRAEMASRLAEDITADTIAWDDGTHANDHVGGCAATHLTLLRELQDYPIRSKWMVVLEEDAVPVHDFRDHVITALEYAPAPIVGLYLGTGNPSGEAQRQIGTAVRAAEAKDMAWIVADCLIGSVGYAVRSKVLDAMIEGITDRDEELPLRISRWVQAQGGDICYTQPSLVNHTDGESIGRPWRGPYFPGRRAWSYGVRDNWDTPAIRLGHCPIWSKEEA